MNRLVLLTLSTAALVACGGKPAAQTPVAVVDPCTAGLHASGVTVQAGTWDAVAVAAGATSADVCSETPCGPDQAYSWVGSAGALAVKVAGGYTVIGDVWAGLDAAPPTTLTRLGSLVHVAAYLETLGREEVVLDDGEETTATVVVDQTYVDYVIDPGTGKVLWMASCSVPGDDNSQPPKIDLAGATFSYTGCRPTATAVAFTADQAASCPSE